MAEQLKMISNMNKTVINVQNNEQMNKFYKILPFFIVEFLAKRFCEKVDNKYIAFDNIYILDKKDE